MAQQDATTDNLDDEQADGQEPSQQPNPGAAAAGDTNKLKAERDELFDRLARATADYKNSQRRMQQEFDQRLQYANAGLIKSLLPVIDNFERALAQDPGKVDAASILKGLQLVHDQWMAVLKKESVEEIAPAPGDAFDVTAGMEAVMQQDAPPELAGRGQVVTQCFAKGYKLNDRVLRPAQVAVSRS
jgi:molecular chaperone GrpE